MESKLNEQACGELSMDELNPSKQVEVECKFVSEKCATHQVNLDKRKVRKRYWGLDKVGLRRWKYRIEVELSCPGLKTISEPRVTSQSVGEFKLSFTNTVSQNAGIQSVKRVGKLIINSELDNEVQPGV